MPKSAKKTKKKVEKSSGQRPVLQFRVSHSLYERLQEAAAENRSTISEEAHDRLSKQVGQEEIFPGIQQVAMLAASAFWHAGQKANDFEHYGSIEWMKDARCRREAFVAGVGALLNLLPISDDKAEMKEALKALSDSMMGDAR